MSTQPPNDMQVAPGLWALPRGHRPSRLPGIPARSRVPELATPVIIRADRWPGSLRSREQLMAAMDELDGHREAKERARRRLALRLLLDWLGGFAGNSWQQRWLASGADAAGRDWPGLVHFRGVNKAYRVTQMTGASSRLILLDAIRRSYAWLALRARASPWVVVVISYSGVISCA